MIFKPGPDAGWRDGLSRTPAGGTVGAMEDWPHRRRPAGSAAGPRATDGALVDGIARALAEPMPRRRAIGLVGGMLLAGSLLRPGRARGDARVCPPSSQPAATKKCQSPGGQSLCTTPDMPCCNTDRCAVACHFYQRCTGEGSGTAACNDTELYCTSPLSPGNFGGTRTKFCSITENAQAGTCHDARQVISGWCCRAGELCGQSYGDCICRGEVCGNNCCKSDEYCDDPVFGEPSCVRLCPGRKHHCNGQCCTASEVCTFTGCDCPSGKTRCGGDCCSPGDDPGDPRPNRNPYDNWGSVAGQSHDSHPTTRARSLFARSAQLSGVDAALDALAAVNGQSGAALSAFRLGGRDPAY